jgi:hypothetical protein
VVFDCIHADLQLLIYTVREEPFSENCRNKKLHQQVMEFLGMGIATNLTGMFFKNPENNL